jgi:hypothetical protein
VATASLLVVASRAISLSGSSVTARPQLLASHPDPTFIAAHAVLNASDLSGRRRIGAGLLDRRFSTRR